MKKKILLSVIIVLMALTMIMAGVACNGNSTPKVTEYTVSFNLNGGQGDAPSIKVEKGKDAFEAPDFPANPTREGYTFEGWATTITGKPVSTYKPTRNGTLFAVWEEIVETSDKVAIGPLLNGLVDSLANLTDAFVTLQDESYMDATLYAVIGDINIELRAAGTFGTSNKGFVQVTVGETAFLTLYTEADVVYIGEALTQEEIKWVKLSQAESNEVISSLFSQLPTLFEGMTLEEGFFNKFMDTPIFNEMSIRGLLGLVGTVGGSFLPATIDTFNTTFDPREKNYDGNFEITLDLSQIGSILSIVEGFISINEILDGLGDNMKGIIDTVVRVLFNGTLDELIAGEIENYPEIKIVGSIENGMLTAIGVSYDNPESESSVAFGLKDVYVSNESNTEIKFAQKAAALDANEAAVRLNIGIEIPGKNIDGVVEAYVIPNVEIGYTVADGFSFDLSGARAFAIAKVDGEEIKLAADYNFYDPDDGYNNAVRIDLKGLYELVGITVTEDMETQYYIPFNLQEWFDGLWASEEVDAPQAAEGEEEVVNTLDTILDIVFGIFNGEEVDIMSLAGELGAVLEMVTDSVALITDNISEDGRLVVADLLDDIVASDLFAGSEYIGEFVKEWLPSDKAVDSVAYFIGWILNDDTFDTATMLDIVTRYSGLTDVDEDTLVALEIGLEGIRSEEEGLGGAISLWTGDTLVVRLSVTIDIVDTYPSEYALTSGFSTLLDLTNEDAQTHILDGLKAILDAYVAK